MNSRTKILLHLTVVLAAYLTANLLINDFQYNLKNFTEERNEFLKKKQKSEPKKQLFDWKFPLFPLYTHIHQHVIVEKKNKNQKINGKHRTINKSLEEAPLFHETASIAAKVANDYVALGAEWLSRKLANLPQYLFTANCIVSSNYLLYTIIRKFFLRYEDAGLNSFVLYAILKIYLVSCAIRSDEMDLILLSFWYSHHSALWCLRVDLSNAPNARPSTPYLLLAWSLFFLIAGVFLFQDAGIDILAVLLYEPIHIVFEMLIFLVQNNFMNNFKFMPMLQITKQVVNMGHNLHLYLLLPGNGLVVFSLVNTLLFMNIVRSMFRTMHQISLHIQQKALWRALEELDDWKGSKRSYNGDSDTDDEEDTCCVCLDSLHTGKVKMLKCGHVYHLDCLKKVVERARLLEHARCPLCRTHFVEHTNNLVTGQQLTEDINQLQQQEEPPVFRFSTESFLPFSWLPSISFEIVRRPRDVTVAEALRRGSILPESNSTGNENNESTDNNNNNNNEVEAAANEQLPARPNFFRRFLNRLFTVDEGTAVTFISEMFPQFSDNQVLFDLRRLGGNPQDVVDYYLSASDQEVINNRANAEAIDLTGDDDYEEDAAEEEDLNEMDQSIRRHPIEEHPLPPIIQSGGMFS